MNIAILLAGGSGSRFGEQVPKQFTRVAGKQIIEHTINAFENCKQIDEICIVSKAEYIPYVEQLVAHGNYQKVRKILAGGKERYHSTLVAIDAYQDDNANLLFHDVVRPLVTERIINECIDALSRYNAVGVAVKTTDTIIAVDANECIETIPDRRNLRNVQTPQCFKRGTIKRAYDLALQDPAFTTTDDCGTIRRYMPQEPVFIVQGENTNIKLTYKEDLLLMELLLTNARNNSHV